jgi:hypothetical protein
MTPKVEFTEEGICSYMNTDPTASTGIHALALEHIQSSKSKASNAKLSSFTKEQFTLKFVECESHTMCSMQSVDVPFHPPLETGEVVLAVVSSAVASYESAMTVW